MSSETTSNPIKFLWEGSHFDQFYKGKLSQRIKGAWGWWRHIENVIAVTFGLLCWFPSWLYIRLGFPVKPRQPFDTWAGQTVRKQCVTCTGWCPWKLSQFLWNERDQFVHKYFKDLINVLLLFLGIFVFLIIKLSSMEWGCWPHLCQV